MDEVLLCCASRFRVSYLLTTVAALFSLCMCSAYIDYTGASCLTEDYTRLMEGQYVVGTDSIMEGLMGRYWL